MNSYSAVNVEMENSEHLHNNNLAYSDGTKSPLHRPSKSNGTASDFDEAFVRSGTSCVWRRKHVTILLLFTVVLFCVLTIFVALYVNERMDRAELEKMINEFRTNYTLEKEKEGVFEKNVTDNSSKNVTDQSSAKNVTTNSSWHSICTTSECVQISARKYPILIM